MIHRAEPPADIESRLQTLGDALRSCSAVTFACLFGSAAEGRLGPLSDVDIAVFPDERSDSFETRLEVVRAATRHLGTDAIDVVALDSAPVSLLGRILRTRRVILDRDPRRRHVFEARALQRFHDFRIFEHRLLERRFGGG